ncbi:gamma-glutamylcyclotransferase [Pararhodospirillum photometricum]|uniref:gamma-glutamylcyclotransferase n=1 Tax=Pararhodospirillum photometricum TaxID=1084 RepID=UPI0002F275E6|nr:gamma-glutamylcyclotransferase [Pararhodospirillum photometricum]
MITSTDKDNIDPSQVSWVFGYGSLMWRPDFPFEETCPALLQGYHRSACILSTQYRGTPQSPGLVLGLEPGGTCHGRAFRLTPALRPAIVAKVRERELITGVYHERLLPVALNDGRSVEALCYVADPAHPQFRGGLALGEAARLVRHGRGTQGAARDYLASCVAHLEDLNVSDPALHQLLRAVDALGESP